MSKRQRPWDRYEAALLLDGLLEVQNGGMKRSAVVRRVSRDLRRMAVNRGEDIDETYRNEKGVYDQIWSMESAYIGHTVSNKASKLFIETVALYRTDRAAYDKLLKEAKQMAEKKPSVEEQFMTWLALQVSPARLSELYWCYGEIDEFCRKIGLLKQPLFETTDIKKIKKLRQTVERNQAFRNRHRKDYRKCVAAAQHYQTFLRDVYRPQPAKGGSAAQTAEKSKPAAPPKETPKAAVPPAQATRKSPGTSGERTVNFNGTDDVAYTVPVRFSWFGEVQEGFSNWKGLYIAVVAALCEDYPQNFRAGMTFGGARKRIDLAEGAGTGMIDPSPVPGTDYVLETNLSAGSMIAKIKYLLDLCRVDDENVVITYRKKDAAPRNSSLRGDFRQPGGKNDRESFRSWLETEAGLAQPTANQYARSIERCETFAREHRYSKWRIYTDDTNLAEALIRKLRSDPEFIAENENRHHQLGAALARYEQYLGIEPTPDERGRRRGEPAKPRPTVPALSPERAEKFLRTKGLTGAKTEQMIEKLCPGAGVAPVRSLLEQIPAVIAMPEGRWVHADAFVDPEEAEEGLLAILNRHFAQFDGYSNQKLLYRAAQNELSMFLNDNDCDDERSVFALAEYFFVKRRPTDPFTFSGQHIFRQRPEEPASLKGLMIRLARRSDGVLTAAEGKSFLDQTLLGYSSLNQVLQIGTSDTFLQYDGTRYLLSEALGIDTDWEKALHDRLDGLFRKAPFVILRDITPTWLGTLPALPEGMDWTLLLLQDVLDKFPDIGFRTVSPDLSQNHDTLAAALVPAASGLHTFPDVVVLYLADRHELPVKMSGEDLRCELRDAGMLQGNELIYTMPKVLDDYRFAWTDGGKTVRVKRG